MAEEEAATAALASAASAPGSIGSVQPTITETPEQAMRRLDARRAWTYCVGLGILCVIGAFAVILLGGDRLAMWLHIGALLATAAASFAYVIARRDAVTYHPLGLLLVVGVACVANLTGFFYWGVYSGYLGVMAVTGYAFASGSPRRPVIVMASVIMVLYAVISVAQLAGWITVRSLVIAAPTMTSLAQVVFLGMVVVVVAGGILGGLDTQAQMRRVLDEHDAALRALAVQEAQLAEARQEVREARGPGDGRYTGERLGRYALREVLGRGAMGEVYAAVDDAGSRYAIKVLAVNLLGNDDARRRFHREARAIAALTTPHVVRMFDVSPIDAPVPYLVMEHLEGDDLRQLLKQQSVRELAEVVTIVRHVAAGLDAAHAAGVVHRDLKPANVFAAQTDGRVEWKILDFGVSKLFDTDATLTSGNIVGTPGYMAPEQARGEEVDRRADVYSLGVLVYRLVTGRPAVMPADSPAMIHDVVYRVPLSPCSIADVPAAVEQVLAIALAKSPDDRFATAGELAAALAEAVAGVGSPVIVQRAAEIVAREPWGQVLRRRASTRAPTTALR